MHKNIGLKIKNRNILIYENIRILITYAQITDCNPKKIEISTKHFIFTLWKYMETKYEKIFILRNNRWTLLVVFL